MSKQRPIYETAAHRLEERNIALQAADAWGLEARKLPSKYCLDYALLKGAELRAMAEVKHRPQWGLESFDRAGGYMLSLHKWVWARAYCGEAGCAFLILLKCADGLCWANFTERPSGVRAGFFNGNNLPRDDDDKEPVLYLPASSFRVLIPA